MNYIAYIVTALSIVGTVANSFQKRWCFVVWAFTNSFWCVFNIINGSYAQAILYAFNLAMAFIGLWKWRKNEKKKRRATMNAKIDFNALLNTAIISGLEKNPEGKVSAEVMKVFAKRGIGVMDAMAMLMEIMAAIQGAQNGGNNT